MQENNNRGDNEDLDGIRNYDKNNVTREEVLRLEERPKNSKQKAFSIIKGFLPIIAGILAIMEYYLWPNSSDGLKQTNVYPIFLAALIVIYLITMLFFSRNLEMRERLIYRAPFYTVVFMLLMLYDILTLKTETLALPYFPWVDMIMNSMITDKSFLIESVLSSLKLLFTGYFIGAILGLITGILAGYFKKVNYRVDPFLKLLGPIPTTTWLPVVMVLAFNLFQGAVFIIALGVWFSVTLATITGIRNVDRSYYEAAETLGASSSELVRKIAIPSATPNIFQGLIAGMSAACNALIVAEMLGVESGLGWYITWKSSWADYSSMYGAIILLALTFIIVNMILKKISNRVLRWKDEGVSA